MSVTEVDAEERGSPLDASPDRCGQLGLPLSTDEDSEEAVAGQMTFTDDGAPLSPDMDWLQELYEEDKGDSGDSDPPAVASSCKKNYAATARMFKLRRNLDQLDRLHHQKEQDMLAAREARRLCRQNIERLTEHRNNLERDIEQQKMAENIVAVFRLRAQHKHLCQKLQSEEELEGHINTKLKQHELELNELEVALGTFSSLRQELQVEEQAFQLSKSQQAAKKLQNQRKTSQNVQIKMKHLMDKQAAMLMKEEAECQRKAEAELASRKTVAKHLKETQKRVRQQAAEKEQQNRELLGKRMQVVESLKSNIAATQESLRAQLKRDKANAQKKEHYQRQLRESLQDQGINTIKHMHQLKQMEETKQKQEEFSARQKSKRAEIVAKILKEEQGARRGKRHQALLPSATDKLTSLRRAREKLQYYLHPSPSSASVEKPTGLLTEYSDTSSSSPALSDGEELQDTVLQEDDHQTLSEILAEPEFTGLWDKDYEASERARCSSPVLQLGVPALCSSSVFEEAPSAVEVIPPPHIRKLLNEKKTLFQTAVKEDKSAMASGKLDLLAKKVYGKDLKGPPFTSKPQVVLFKDFDVGTIYKKRVVLTNIRYIPNCCRLLGVSAHLKDSVSIRFEPPGPLSTGMSCEMQAVFHPMINEDLEGEVQFATEVGPFSVPIKCTIKKCELEVDSKFIDLGSHVVGKTVSQTLTLTNKGALATFFSLVTSERLSSETSRVQMPPQDTHSQGVTSNNKRRSALRDHGELQPESENQELSEELRQEKPEVSDTGIPEACASTNADVQMDQSHSDSGDIHLGDVKSGPIGPFESIKLEVLFTPTIPGEAKLDFLIKFSDKASKPIPVQVKGVAVSFPVSVVWPNIDLKICMFDHLYQESIVLQSSSSSALKVTFEVCPEMRKHMEILPKTGVIQAHSSFNAHLKFLPRGSLSKDAKMFFDRNTGVLEVPMMVQVAGQVKPVQFTVQAVVTSSELRFDRTEVDFGYCSIYQSVKSSVRLTNQSLLLQEFGFVGLPEFIEVQPNDGFGLLLPQETLEIDLIFSATKAKEYSFQITCKSGINREFLLSCQGTGVRPPLELSHSLVQFGATAVGDYSTATLYLINHEINQKQSKQMFPSIIKDAASPVAARKFSFVLPKDSEVSITPAAGVLGPREKILVQVTFRPRLLDQEIKDEALRLLHRATLLTEEMEGKRRPEQETNKGVSAETRKEKKASAISNNSKVSDSPEMEQINESPSPTDIQPGLQQYEEARMSLLHAFTPRCSRYMVPCFVANKSPSEEDCQEQPSWSPLNTLYLKLQCPAVRPPLVVISHSGNIIDFHQVAVGERAIERITIQNISMDSLDLSSSVLDLHGAFSLLNALRHLRPGEKHTLVLAFSPPLKKMYCETLEVRSQKMTLEITLHGEGVVAAVTCSHPGGDLDFGYVLEKESTSQVLQLQNSSTVAIGFRVQLASLSPSSLQGEDDKVAILLGGYAKSQLQLIVGTQNYSGLSVFTAAPVEGSIAPGQSQDINVTFQPDHPSLYYSDRLTIELSNQSKVCVMDLKGAASSYNLYICGGDTLSVPIESFVPPLSTILPHPTEVEVMEKPTISVLVTLKARLSAGAVIPAVRELQVGCASKPNKRGGEFLLDGVRCQGHGFTMEPSKGGLKPGEKCTITVTWTPPSGYKPFEVVQTCVPVTLKGDETIIYRVTLMASISTTAD